MKQNTQTKRQVLETNHGVRYSELLKLPYFDCISFTVVDPMHNLFLGTSKYVFKTVWANTISQTSLIEIQKAVDDMVVPTTLGRIPHKIKSSFSSFTADQWKNWTLYFSPVVLKGHIPVKDYNCWLLFVEACRILSVPSITIQDLKRGHEKLMTFLRDFEQLYGSLAVTPNMHLHTHLIECILDYGPMHVFWLYSFERMNGVLGSFNTNQRSVEIQLIRKLSQAQSTLMFKKPELFSEIFGPVFTFQDDANKYKTNDADIVLRVLSLSTQPVRLEEAWFHSTDICFIGPRYNVNITEHSVDHLRQSLQQFSDTELDCVSGSCHKYKSIEICGEKYGSSDSRLSRSSVILASWCGTDGNINTSGIELRPGIVRFYVSMYVHNNGSMERVTMAYIHWLQKVSHQRSICTVADVWCHKLFEPEGPACFMPVQRIACKCICAKVIIKNEELLAIIPHIRQIYW